MRGSILVTRPVESRYGSLLESAAPGVTRKPDIRFKLQIVSACRNQRLFL